jgi:hypothetical protein
MDDSGIPSEVATAFLALKRDYTRMVNQGMSREAIAAELRTWMLRGMARTGETMPHAKITHYLKLTLCLLEVQTPAQAKRLAALIRRAYECN